MPTFLCPKCTHGRTLDPERGREREVRAAYRTRVYDDHECCALAEDENGQFAEGDTFLITSTWQRRVEDLTEVLQSVPRDRPHRVLHVGSGDGRFLAMASRRHKIVAQGLEPWRPWIREAAARGVPTRGCTIEEYATVADACADERFDVIVEHHLLEHLDDPRTHIRRLKQQLKADGVIIIEVPNLLRAYGSLEARFLQEAHAQVFTPRSLATLCFRAGLVPIHLDSDANMRVFCRLAIANSARPGLPDGATVQAVFSSVWANDMRLTLKRALVHAGPTEEILRLAARTCERCDWAPGRADLELEVAIALEKAQRYADAVQWIRRSLHNRADPDVACILHRLQAMVRSEVTPTRSEPDPGAAGELWTAPRPARSAPVVLPN
ncbi:MAG: class I SAM-dependent methyltransferase [Nannocystaceae bacterium]